MASNVKPWLWEMLVTDCGIDEGRSVYVPESGLLISAFQVVTERNTTHVIKTLASGFSFSDRRDPADLEVTVLRVESQRETDNGELEFLAVMENGSREWLGSRAFFSDDGTVTESFLSTAGSDVLARCLELYSLAALKEMCKGQRLKATGTQKVMLAKRLRKYYLRQKVPQLLLLPSFIFVGLS